MEKESIFKYSSHLYERSSQYHDFAAISGAKGQGSSRNIDIFFYHFQPLKSLDFSSTAYIIFVLFVLFTAKLLRRARNLHTQAINLVRNRATAIDGISFSQRTNKIKWDVAPHWG
jgi:hypothetical protein